jgi:hypothetical protein
MGSIELHRFEDLGFLFLAIPIITLVIVVQINNQDKQIEGKFEHLRSSA